MLWAGWISHQQKSGREILYRKKLFDWHLRTIQPVIALLITEHVKVLALQPSHYVIPEMSKKRQSQLLFLLKCQSFPLNWASKRKPVHPARLWAGGLYILHLSPAGLICKMSKNILNAHNTVGQAEQQNQISVPPLLLEASIVSTPATTFNITEHVLVSIFTP